MRIVIDLQGAQSESRFRGIGRYSLSIVKHIIKNCSDHEIILILNGQFDESIKSIRESFDGLLDSDTIKVWPGFQSVSYCDIENTKKRKLGEFTYEAFLATQNPDFIFITSLFEGFESNASTSVHRLQKIAPVAVILYDLIPFINSEVYLENNLLKRWYLEKIDNLKNADIWLSISESSRQEGIKFLGLPDDRVYNISTDADEYFKSITIAEERESLIRKKYGLKKSFLMYTGGIDHRKNIEGLISAYANLPKGVKDHHQLAIVCSVQQSSRESLENLALSLGLKNGDIVLTGFVPDEDLLALYNICKLFVFPSLHEGFGLPALEAMRCGVPVIGSNQSSLPEVIGTDQALFDPKSIPSMTRIIERGLVDNSFRDSIRHQQSSHQKKFSWDLSAQKAISAMDNWRKENWCLSYLDYSSTSRPKLAFVSPIPPARTGIADYCAELLPELANYYEIEVITDQEETATTEWITDNIVQRSVAYFLDNHHSYDRILYQFGNSEFHSHMFAMLEEVPGVVVLHDFYLSGVLAHNDVNHKHPMSWIDEIYKSHGYVAVSEKLTSDSSEDIVMKYPANLSVIQSAMSIIVHSQHSKQLAECWYGKQNVKNWNVVPHLRIYQEYNNKAEARNQLGFKKEDLIVCAFGVLGPTKLNDRLLNAWIKSPLAKNENAHLIFVGQGNEDFTLFMQDKIRNSGLSDKITITGWASSELFSQYLHAADIGVQLRKMSRGETSGTVLDCMNHGLATIVNAYGSMADLDPAGVWKMNDDFSEHDLISALTKLANDKELRDKLGNQARLIIKNKHDPAYCAKLYYEAVETSYKMAESSLSGLIDKVSTLELDTEELGSLAKNLASCFPPVPRTKQLFIDVTASFLNKKPNNLDLLSKAMFFHWLKNPSYGYRIQPIYLSPKKSGYQYAHKLSCNLLGISDKWIEDTLIDAWEGDICIALGYDRRIIHKQIESLSEFSRLGVKLWFAAYDFPANMKEDNAQSAKEIKHLLLSLNKFVGITCLSKQVADTYSKSLVDIETGQRPSLKIKYCTKNQPFDIQYQDAASIADDFMALVDL